MNILVINAGSSSVKYQLIKMPETKVIAKGGVERIGIEGANLEHKPNGADKVVITQPIADHTEAITMVLNALTDEQHGVIKSMDEISAVGHRVVHGSEFFSSGVIVDDQAMEWIQECAELAPLHNPANLMGVKACQSIMPNTPMVTVFDTAFHQTMPQSAYLYGLSYEAYEKYRVRKYGFHGTSHKFVAQRYAEITNQNIEDLKIITCHLGNGSSVCAVDGGKSVDTSMGFTPLEGLVMGTRSGDIDPAIGAMQGFTVLNIDDLTAQRTATAARLEETLAAARRVCREATKDLARWENEHDALQPAIRTLYETFESVRRREVERNLHRFDPGAHAHSTAIRAVTI